MMKQTLNTLIILSTTLPFTVMADTQMEMQRFQKCYGIFVGERAPLTDSLWLKVKSGAISGTDACMQIFDRAKLSNNGEVQKSNGVVDPIGMKVLNSFMKFHKSQLQVPEYGKVIGASERFTRDVTDGNEAVYHFLYSTFGANQKYSDVVTRNYSLKSKRITSFPDRARSVLNVNLPILMQGSYTTKLDENGINQTIPNEALGGVAPFPVELAETGLLYGLAREDRQNIISNKEALKGYVFTSLDIHQHHGAGAIGTQAYLMANLGKDTVPNGGTGLYRRWGKHVMEDFLCRALPVLRTTDVVDEVNFNSSIAFRTGSSCMACHSGMDPLSAVARNVRTSWSHNTGNFSTRVKFVGVRAPTLPHAEMPTDKNEAAFFQRVPSGRLFYRSYDGSLVREEMEGIRELGEVLAESNDLYVCAAKRYYKYLTGIDVDLSDIGDINTPEFSTGQINQRKKVIDMGMNLKNHQSVRETIKTIIKSQTFIQPDKGV